MSISISTKTSGNGEKKWYYFEWGNGNNERKAAAIFTYITCKALTQRNHNKEALMLLETKKKPQLTLEQQSIGTLYIPNTGSRAIFWAFTLSLFRITKRRGIAGWKVASRSLKIL